MGKSSKKSATKVEAAPPASTTKPLKKGKREAEDLDIQVNPKPKKQKKDLIQEKKVEEKAPKKVETSSSDSSDSEEEEKKEIAETKKPDSNNGSLKANTESSSESDSSSSDEESIPEKKQESDEDESSSSDEESEPVKKQPVVKDVKAESSSSEDDSSSEDEDSSPVKKQPVVQEAKAESSSSEGESSSDEEEPASTEKKVAIAKKVSKDSSSSEDESEDEKKPEAAKKPADSSSEEEESSSDDESDDEEKSPLKKAKLSSTESKKSSSDESSEESDEESEDEKVTPKKSEDDVKMVDVEQKSNVKQPKTPTTGSKTLFAGNLSFKIDKPDIEKFFKDVGEVVDIRFAMSNEDNSFKGYGHVEFASAEAAEKAMELNGEQLLGRPIRLDPARERGEFNTPRSSNSSKNYQNLAGKGSDCRTICVKRLGNSTLGEEELRSALRDHFETCGVVTRIAIPTDRETGATRGMAFIDLKDGFEMAMEQSGTEIGGCRIVVDEARARGPKPEEDSGDRFTRGRANPGRFTRGRANPGRSSRGINNNNTNRFANGRTSNNQKPSLIDSSQGKKTVFNDDE